MEDRSLGIEGWGRRWAVLIEYSRACEQGRQRHPERVGDRTEHPERRLVAAALELAQVRVGDPGRLGEVAQGPSRGDALGADEGTQGCQLRVCALFAHARIFAQSAADTPDATAGQGLCHPEAGDRQREPRTVFGDADRRRLLADVARLVEGHGGRIAVDYITHLLLARNAPLG